MSTFANSSSPTLIPVGAAARWSRAFEALRYLAASVAALALDAGLLWVCTAQLAWPVWLAGAVAYGGGLVLIYLLSVRWVFTDRADRKVRRAGAEFTVFALLGLVGLVLNSATLTVATAVGLSLPVAKAISAGIGFVANFVSRKMVLFSSSRR